MSLKTLLPVPATLVCLAFNVAPVRAIEAASTPTPTPVAEAASTASGSSGAEVRALEGQLQELQATNEFQRRALAQLHDRVAAAESVAAWMPWLGGALLLTLGGSAYLGWRASRPARGLNGAVGFDARNVGVVAVPPAVAAPLSPPRPAAMADFQPSILPAGQPSTAAGLGPIDELSNSITQAVLAAARSVPVDATAPVTTEHVGGRMPSEPSTTPAVTAAAVRPARAVPLDLNFGTGVPARSVSVEELLDLEQQVDFFMVLGQHESAVDLLVGHIRATGGTSALPYLKLLEIYRGQNELDGYERTRSRFNQRFSAEAPPWGESLNQGRSLEQYGEVLARLQVLWAEPAEAVRELDRLMHLSERGQLFDLPAFRDLLLLHGVAGDLAGQAELPDAIGVDILLPLDADDAGSGTAQPAPAAALPALTGHAKAALAALQEATARASRPMKLDLDLSDDGGAHRDYTQPAAFTSLSALGMGPAQAPARAAVPDAGDDAGPAPDDEPEPATTGHGDGVWPDEPTPPREPSGRPPRG